MKEQKKDCEIQLINSKSVQSILIFLIITVVLCSHSSAQNLPVIVHYGLNGSHSRDWAQVNKNDIVGITYFQRFEGSVNEGTLIYKTIHPDGFENIDSVTTGIRLEKSILLYDSLSSPHIFIARSDSSDQVIDHYYKNASGLWQSETIIHFYNEGGKFIYELSGDIGPDHSFHLLILKTRSNIDSDDYNWAWLDSYLYYLTNVTGNWKKELVHNYDMAYTYDHQIKISSRQDIKIDNDSYVHVIFGEQINGFPDPSRLWYATNKTGIWEFEIALNPDSGSRDEAGWMASLCLDNYGVPFISCMYKKRVSSGSAVFCKLLLLKRLGDEVWHSEIISDHDDGYYGSDGRNYTGGLSHLVFDTNNTPRIIFSDIASAHWGVGGTNRLSVGNIRYAYFKDGDWDITTIYRQPLPTGFFRATEMYGLCLIISDVLDSVRIIGQELEITGENQYTCTLLNLGWKDTNFIDANDLLINFELKQNYPNPFNQRTAIKFSIPEPVYLKVKIYNIQGQLIKTLISDYINKGSHIIYWDGRNDYSDIVSTGVYFYKIISNNFNNTRKMLLLR